MGEPGRHALTRFWTAFLDCIIPLPGPLSVGNPPLCDISAHRLIEMLLSPCLVCKAVRDLGRHQGPPAVPPVQRVSTTQPHGLVGRSDESVYMSLPGRSTAPPCARRRDVT